MEAQDGHLRQCCLASIETVENIRDGESRSTSPLTQLLSYVTCVQYEGHIQSAGIRSQVVRNA